MARKHLFALLLAPLLAFAQAEPAEAVLIDFESQANGTNLDVTNPFPEVSFSTVAGFNVRVFGFASSIGTSGTQNIGVVPGFIQGFTLDFTNPVENLSFHFGADDGLGTVGLVDVFVSGVLNSTVNMTGDGNTADAELVDLTAFTDVTRIVVRSVTDPFGLAYDDFSFDAVAQGGMPVPEPSSLAIFAVGLAGLGFMGWRRRSAPVG